MNCNEWERLRKSDFASYEKQYTNFMFNSDNICKCNICPANEGVKDWDIYPCGQYNCWVKCACKQT